MPRIVGYNHSPQFSSPRTRSPGRLLLEGVNDSAVALIEAAGYSSVTRAGEGAGRSDAEGGIKGVHILGIRSADPITSDVSRRRRLIAIGCF